MTAAGVSGRAPQPQRVRVKAAQRRAQRGNALTCLDAETERRLSLSRCGCHVATTNPDSHLCPSSLLSGYSVTAGSVPQSRAAVVCGLAPALDPPRAPCSRSHARAGDPSRARAGSTWPGGSGSRRSRSVATRAAGSGSRREWIRLGAPLKRLAPLECRPASVLWSGRSGSASPAQRTIGGRCSSGSYWPAFPCAEEPQVP